MSLKNSTDTEKDTNISHTQGGNLHQPYPTLYQRQWITLPRAIEGLWPRSPASICYLFTYHKHPFYDCYPITLFNDTLHPPSNKYNFMLICFSANRWSQQKKERRETEERNRQRRDILTKHVKRWSVWSVCWKSVWIGDNLFFLPINEWEDSTPKTKRLLNFMSVCVVRVYLCLPVCVCVCSRGGQSIRVQDHQGAYQAKGGQQLAAKMQWGGSDTRGRRGKTMVRVPISISLCLSKSSTLCHPPLLSIWSLYTLLMMNLVLWNDDIIWTCLSLSCSLISLHPSLFPSFIPLFPSAGWQK